MRRLLRLERLAYGVALTCLLVATARFGWTLTRTISVKAASNITVWTSTRVSKNPAAPDLAKSLSMQMQTPESIHSAIAAAVGTAQPTVLNFDKSTTPQHEFVNAYLSVQVGQPRSELRVNGRLVGKTPFVGQIGCERGQPVKLDVLPPQGMPKQYEIPCLAGEMELRDEP
jgi:hypothetical protein